MDTEIKPSFPLTLRRILLILITLVVSAIMSSALIASWNEPQVASRLELYQTDLLLRATAWEGQELPPEQVATLRQNLLGENPIDNAQETYTSVRATAAQALAEAKQPDAGATSESPRLRNARQEQAELLDLIDLRLGILQAEQGNLEAAQARWQMLQTRQTEEKTLVRIADVLSRLYGDQPLPANSEDILSDNLQGWFRNRALAQLYDRTQAPEKLIALQQTETASADKTILTLAAVGVLPALGALTGALVLIGVGLQRLMKGADSLLARNRDRRWETPWTAETILWVLVGGFLFMGQWVVPLLISPLRGVLASEGIRGQALFALLYYLMMAIGAIAVLSFAIRQHRPLPGDWFTFKFGGNWLLWGLGGYLAALPLMLTISLANQQIWQGQGGSNPLLQTVLEAQDPVALALFFTTAAIAAPLFEELLFRGFLLPSLTRYLPVWAAIGLSSLIFAIAHLSLSEVLPLMALGIVLGIVYTRSRNLLAPMLLHSAWNSITMLGLFLLGSSAS
jgi:hypothetical protein